jgi:hypothetical protein
MLEIEKVPCEICGTETQYTGTKRCDNCWEVETRIDYFLNHKKGRDFIKRKLKSYENTNK